MRLRGGVPNTADSASTASVHIAAEIMAMIGATSSEPITNPGAALESAVESHILADLPSLRPDVAWEVKRNRLVSEFEQYHHLSQLQALIDADASRTLAVEIGGDYLIRPDVTVGVTSEAGAPRLHASVSCKWTIRSDRVQNIRHEAVVLIRHRRGRLPHIVCVTMEPLPSRLASIARGTGEVDCVYHPVLAELRVAVEGVGPAPQRSILEELIEQRRLRPLEELAPTLAL